MRHNSKLIQKIIQMRTDGFTLGEIVTETGLSKTTIHHHIKLIPKSPTLLQKIKNKTRVAQKILAQKRRGISIKAYSFSRPLKWNQQMVNVICHFLFDGQIKRTSCIYYNRSPALRDLVIKGMKDVFSVDDYKIYDASGGVKRVCYFNVELASYIMEKSKELLNDILNAPREQKLSFLKAFFDDEGCISLSNKKRLVRGYQHSLPILELVHKLLFDFDIDSWVDKKYLELYISRKDNLIKFQKHINFTPGLFVNGERSNSIWKKSLEKREILKMAIESYKN